RSKDGKRFGFVRFINVFNVERLVSDLCTILVHQSKFHANITRFHKAPLNNNKVLTEQKFGYNRNINNARAKEGVTTGSSKSYVHAVKVKNMFGALECDSKPSIVLDDECLISKDLSKALLGRENIGVGSWISVLKQASSYFIPEGRIVWVEIEGIPFKLWSNTTFKWIAAKWGELLGVDDQEEEGFHSKRLCIYSKSDDSDDYDESDNGFKDGDAKVQDGGRCGNDSDDVEVSKTMFEESLEQKVNQSEDPFGANVFNAFIANAGREEEWLNDNWNKSKSVSDQLKEELQKLDADIHKGIESDDIINKRLEVLNSIQHLDKIKAMDVAQKPKIKWAIEGDENTRQFWSSIENDVFAAVSHFFTFGDIPNGCNSYFIALIPKVPDANLVKDFRPISLIGSMYKIIAKILANRLVGVLRDIVNEVQSVFITERQILDGPFILNEAQKCLETCLGCNLGRRLSIRHELNSNKASWVKWKSVLASKEKGGLGVLSLYALNRALMMKWVWRFYSQKESLWERVIKAIYGDDGQVGKVSRAGSRSCWRNIVNEVRILSNQGIKVLDYMRIKLGNGESTAFWDDNWISGKVMYSFPRIYALETEKEVTVNSKMSDTRLENSLRRSIRGGVEQVQFNELSDMLQSVSLMPYSDRWVWSLEGSGEFSVTSIQNIIDDNRLSTVDTRTLWIKYVPIKVNVLAWKIKIEALLRRFNISRRGIDIDSILCPIYECGVESARHVFFSCSLVRQIVCKVSSWWDVMYIDVNSYVEWLNLMNSLRLKSISKLMIEGVFYVVWWHVWMFRNKLLFMNKSHQRRLSLMTLFLDHIIGVSLDVKPRSVGTIGLKFLI
nr:RNA-directed DNA polymerase, eukaryota, reverse transcriptase zinc-binding domain protein [Tanacetum cinerariifolium]